MTINERIKQRRIDCGYSSHQALADVLGVSWQTVQLWEKDGGTAPSRKRMPKVAEALSTTPEWLLQGIVADGTDAAVSRAETAAPSIGPPEWMAPEAYQLLTYYYSADVEGRAQILDYAAGMSGQRADNLGARNQG